MRLPAHAQLQHVTDPYALTGSLSPSLPLTLCHTAFILRSIEKRGDESSYTLVGVSFVNRLLKKMEQARTKAERQKSKADAKVIQTQEKVNAQTEKALDKATGSVEKAETKTLQKMDKAEKKLLGDGK